MKKKIIFITIIIITIIILVFILGLGIELCNLVNEKSNTGIFNKEANEKLNTYIYDKNGTKLDMIEYGDISYFDNVKSYYMASALESILNDMMQKENVTESEAEKILVTNGYKIYLCEDYETQEKLEQVYKNDDNFLVDIESSTIILDNITGEVRAIVGGRNKKNRVITFGEYNKSGNLTNENAATERKFQPTHMLPIISVYACGLEKGIINLDSIYSDDYLEENSTWNPKNYYNYSQGDITIKKAIETGSNLVKIRVLQDIGIETSYEFVQSIVITGLSEIDKNLASLALGGLTYGVKPIEISSAYRTVLTDGIYKEPIFYNKVVDKDGVTYLEKNQNEKYIVKEEVCNQLKSCLSSTINDKQVYLKEAKHAENWEHWCSITTDKYTYTTLFYNKGKFEEINSKENVAKELLTKIVENENK